MVRIGRTVMPGAFIGQMTQESAGRGLRGRIGADQQLLPVGNVGEARPDLVAVDDELVAVDFAACFQARKIGPGAGLGKALAPDDIAGEDLGQVQSAFCSGVPQAIKVGPAWFSPTKEALSGEGAPARAYSSNQTICSSDRETATAEFLWPRDSRPTALRLRSSARPSTKSREAGPSSGDGCNGTFASSHLRAAYRKVEIDPVTLLSAPIVSNSLRERSTDLMLQDLAGIVLR